MDATNSIKKKRRYKQYLSNPNTTNISRRTKLRWKKQKHFGSPNLPDSREDKTSCSSNNGQDLAIISNAEPWQRAESSTESVHDGDSEGASTDEYQSEDSSNTTDITDDETQTEDSSNSVSDIADCSDEPEVDQNQEITHDADDDIMFHESGITKKAVLLMVHGFALRHKLTKQAHTDLLELMKVCANLKEDDTFKASRYMLSKRFAHSDELLQYTYYCQSCKSQLGEPTTEAEFEAKTVICPNVECQLEADINLQNRNYFISVDTRSQIQHILKRNTLEIMHVLRNENEVRDIFDSILYKNIAGDKKQLLTYNFSTDGAPVFASSKLSMWPIQLIINNLSPKIRFKNLIFAGIWVGRGEPSVHLMNTIMKAFAKHAKVLYEIGVTISNELGEDVTYKLLPLLCPCDSVARPVLQNRVQYNGYYGCSWCYQIGEPVNRQIKYPVEAERDLRTRDSHVADLRDVINGGFTENIRGVKGPSTLLLQLPHFDPVWSFPLDYMHGVVLGVVKQLWELFSTYSTKSKHNFYIGMPAQLEKLNKRLLQITPSSEIDRLPRSLGEKCKWKASEWKNFLLFYALPCLQGILKETYLNNFALLVHSIYILLQDVITQEEMKAADRCIKLFVSEFQSLYGIEAMTFNVHTLLHITECVKRTGPLWATSTFPFESGIYRIKQQIKGPVGVAKQIAKKMIKINTFLSETLSHENSEESCKMFSRHLFLPKQLRFVKKYGDVTLLGSGSVVNIQEANLYLSFSKANVTGNNHNMYSFNRCIYKDMLIHSVDYKKAKRTNDTTLHLKTKEFMTVHKILLCNGKIYIFGASLFSENVTFGKVTLKHMFKVIHFETEFKLVKTCQIESKCMNIKFEHQSYICMFPNTYEVQ